MPPKPLGVQAWPDRIQQFIPQLAHLYMNFYNCPKPPRDFAISEVLGTVVTQTHTSGFIIQLRFELWRILGSSSELPTCSKCEVHCAYCDTCVFREQRADNDYTDEDALEALLDDDTTMDTLLFTHWRECRQAADGSGLVCRLCPQATAGE